MKNILKLSTIWLDQLQVKSDCLSNTVKLLCVTTCIIYAILLLGGEIEIQAGEHKFPFTCSLPPNLPSSFESDFGHVRYTVKATLDRPWKFDQDVKSPFTVISPFDLNQESRAAVSIRYYNLEQLLK